MRSWMEDMLAHHTGRTSSRSSKDIERDKILTAEEAKEYGLIDEVSLAQSSPRAHPGRRTSA
jgi:ATP-dependent Clp protease protease subunit